MICFPLKVSWLWFPQPYLLPGVEEPSQQRSAEAFSRKLWHRHPLELSRRKCSVCHGLNEELMNWGPEDQKFHKLELTSDSRRNRTNYLRFGLAATAQHPDLIQVETATPMPLHQPLNCIHLWLSADTNLWMLAVKMGKGLETITGVKIL